jgi:hypothetical protein
LFYFAFWERKASKPEAEMCVENEAQPWTRNNIGKEEDRPRQAGSPSLLSKATRIKAQDVMSLDLSLLRKQLESQTYPILS